MKNGKIILNAALCLTLLVFIKWVISDEENLAARGHSPILSLQTEARIPQFLIEKIIRDPEIQAPANTASAEHLIDENQKMAEELSHAQPVRKKALLRKLFQNNAALSYYYANLLAHDKQAAGSNLQQSLTLARNNSLNYSKQYAQYSKSKREKATALYHGLMTRYLLGENAALTSSSLAKIRNNLNIHLSRRAKFFITAHDVMNTGSIKSIAELRREVNTLGTEGKIAINLLSAQGHAGISGSGNKRQNANNSYRTYLNSATKSAASLNHQQKEKVIGFAAHVWIKAAGNKIIWSDSPIASQIHSLSPNVLAIRERDALQNYKSGKINAAIKTYDSIAAGFAGSPVLLALDRRILDLRAESFAKNKDVNPYVMSLLKIKAKYENNGILGKGNENQTKAAYDEFHSRYKALVFITLKKAKERNSTLEFRNTAIKIATVYSHQTKNDQEKEQINESIAVIYTISGEHKKAVAIYSKLINASESGSSKQIKYLLAAISSQRVLAQWPLEAPWQGIKKAALYDRGQLAELYSKLIQARPKETSWPALAHVGLIHINRGEANKAFAIWTPNLAKSPVSEHARRAAGLMLLTHSSRKAWQALEDAARICTTKNITPLAGKKNLNALTYLGDALFNGAKQAYDKNRFAASVKKLEEFTRSFRSDTRRDHAFFILAAAYRGNAQHPESIEALVTLVNQYPTSSFHQRALLHGGEWSNELAFEDHVIFFYRRFVDQYKKDKKIGEISERLIALYLAKENYGDASRIYRDQSLDVSLALNKRIGAACRYLEIEEKYGDTAKAKLGSDLIRKIASANDEAMALSYGFEARSQGEKISLESLRRIEAKLAALNKSSREVIEQLAMVRFFIAENGAAKTKEDIFNLGLKDPLATINQHHEIFQRQRAQYERICSLGNNSYCAPAMFKLARMTNNTMITIQDVKIQDSLDASSVKKFDERKRTIVANLENVTKDADERAVSYLSLGTTTPVWTQQILWSTSRDWEFDNSGNEVGNSYVQWSINGSESN